jgi:hypothetical protein
VKTELSDAMITFKGYPKIGLTPYIFNIEDPKIEWDGPNNTYIHLYGNYSILEIQTEDGWKTALIKERHFKTSLRVASYTHGFGSKTPVMCFLTEEDARKAEKENIFIDKGTYNLLIEQDLIRAKDLPRKYQIYVYD